MEAPKVVEMEKKGWSLKVSGIHVCHLKSQKRIVKEFYAAFTQTPKLVIQVWSETTKSFVNSVELDECQTCPMTGDLKWPGETTLNVGKHSESRNYIFFTLATQSKLSLGKKSVVTLAAARLQMDKVPKIVDDEGTWFVDLLPLTGSLCNPDSRLGVQLALVPTQDEKWFDLPRTPTDQDSQTFLHQNKQAVWAETESEKIVDLLEEAWTAGTIGRSPTQTNTPESSSPRFFSQHAENEKMLDAPLSMRVHLHKICDLHNFNFLSLTGNTSIYAILYHADQWKRTKIQPKSSSPVFNDMFEFQIFEPTAYITIAFIEEVQMPFSGMKERFRTSKLLGKIVIQPCCFPANKKCHLKMNILSNKLIQRASPYVLVSVCLSYESFWQLLDIYRTPISQKARQLPVMDTMPAELKALSTEDLMDLWSKNSSYSLTASITSARRTLRRAKNAKQELDVFVLEPFINVFKFLQSWKQPLLSILFLISYCRLCITPKYIPSVLLLLIAAVPLYQYQSNLQYAIMFKSKFLTYKTWRAAEVCQGDTDAQDSLTESPKLRAEEQEHWIHNAGDSDEEGSVTDGRGGLQENTESEKQSGVRMRIRTVAKLAQDYSNNVQIYSSYIEKILHLVFWTDPRLSVIFLAGCLSGALLLLLIPANYVAMFAGCYILRPPQLRSSGNGIVMNLLSRLPDNVDTF